MLNTPFIHSRCKRPIRKQHEEEILLYLAPLQEGFFLYSYRMEFVQIKHRVRQNEVLSGGVSAILRSGLILENIRRMFLLSVWVTGTMYMNCYEKPSPNVLENQTMARLFKASLA